LGGFGRVGWWRVQASKKKMLLLPAKWPRMGRAAASLLQELQRRQNTERNTLA